MNNSIDRALGLRPLEEALASTADIDAVADIVVVVPDEILPAVVDVRIESDETLKDIEKARKNIERIIELGDESLDEIVSLAKQSESPRAFEVASTLMKTLLDANKEFVEMSTRKKYAKEEILNPKEDEKAQTNVVNNNLILSTADLLKMIKGET